ncbi:hypothetical protein PAXINDRAFT_21169 [Paxillus involutus ATCC 200175]|uniref:Uncharacterized protein n=1 Tax=Paxillus involutus ATCC 200175 TaxID=664439 RepID=A0A0C9STP4_PAXIN|nr:hypothetical protein PAXINDRAFT_21169 [Paxillus involutus ATCC 200175]
MAPPSCKKEDSIIKSNGSISLTPPGSNRNNWGEGDSLATNDTLVINAWGADQRVAAQRVGANSALCMHTRKGISTQRSDGGEESQEGLHSEETMDGWK